MSFGVAVQMRLCAAPAAPPLRLRRERVLMVPDLVRAADHASLVVADRASENAATAAAPPRPRRARALTGSELAWARLRSRRQVRQPDHVRRARVCEGAARGCHPPACAFAASVLHDALASCCNEGNIRAPDTTSLTCDSALLSRIWNQVRAIARRLRRRPCSA